MCRIIVNILQIKCSENSAASGIDFVFDETLSTRLKQHSLLLLYKL